MRRTDAKTISTILNKNADTVYVDIETDHDSFGGLLDSIIESGKDSQ